MQRLQKLKDAVEAARKELTQWDFELKQAQALPENNVYPSLEDAEYKIEGILSDMAYEDCEGEGNCGAEEYRQLFMVGDKSYVGIYNPEYNRYDKTYYYVDGSEFRIEGVV